MESYLVKREASFVRSVGLIYNEIRNTLHGCWTEAKILCYCQPPWLQERL